MLVYQRVIFEMDNFLGFATLETFGNSIYKKYA
jgi:hypothetical protein